MSWEREKSKYRAAVMSYLGQKIPNRLLDYYEHDWEKFAKENFRHFYRGSGIKRKRIQSEAIFGHTDKPLYKALLKSVRDSPNEQRYNQCAVRVSRSIIKFIQPDQIAVSNFLSLIGSERFDRSPFGTKNVSPSSQPSLSSWMSRDSKISEASFAALEGSCSMMQHKPRLVKEGFLWKKATRSTFSSRYQTRFFRIFERTTPLGRDYFMIYQNVKSNVKASRNTRYHSSTLSASDKQRLIPITKETEIYHGSEESLNFEIRNKDRNLKLRANTKKEKSEWIQSLSYVMQAIKTKTCVADSENGSRTRRKSTPFLFRSSSQSSGSNESKHKLHNSAVAVSLKEGFMEFRHGNNFVERYLRMIEYQSEVGHVMIFLICSLTANSDPLDVIFLTGATVALSDTKEMEWARGRVLEVASDVNKWHLRTSTRTEAIIWLKELQNKSGHGHAKAGTNYKTKTQVKARFSRYNSCDRDSKNLLDDIQGSVAFKFATKALSKVTQLQLLTMIEDEVANCDMRQLARIVYTAGTMNVYFGTDETQNDNERSKYGDYDDLELKDEVYAQLLRHIHKNPNNESKVRCMLLVALCSLRFKPSDVMEGPWIGKLISLQATSKHPELIVLARFVYANFRNSFRNCMSLAAVARHIYNSVSLATTGNTQNCSDSSQRRKSFSSTDSPPMLRRRSMSMKNLYTRPLAEVPHYQSHSFAAGRRRSSSRRILPEIQSSDENIRSSTSTTNHQPVNNARTNSHLTQTSVTSHGTPGISVLTVSPSKSRRASSISPPGTRNSLVMDLLRVDDISPSHEDSSSYTPSNASTQFRNSSPISRRISSSNGATVEVQADKEDVEEEKRKLKKMKPKKTESTLGEGLFSIFRRNRRSKSSVFGQVAKFHSDSIRKQSLTHAISQSNLGNEVNNRSSSNVDIEAVSIEHDSKSGFDYKNSQNGHQVYFGEPCPPRFLRNSRLIALSKKILISEVACYEIAHAYYNLDPGEWRDDFIEFSPTEQDEKNARKFLNSIPWLRRHASFNRLSHGVKAKRLLSDLDPIENLCLRLLRLPNISNRISFVEYASKFAGVVEDIRIWFDVISDALSELVKNRDRIRKIVRKARQIAGAMRLKWNPDVKNKELYSHCSRYVLSNIHLLSLVASPKERGKRSIIDFLVLSLKQKSNKTLKVFSTLKNLNDAANSADSLDKIKSDFFKKYDSLRELAQEERKRLQETSQQARQVQEEVESFKESTGRSRTQSIDDRKKELVNEKLNRLLGGVNEGLRDNFRQRLCVFVENESSSIAALKEEWKKIESKTNLVAGVLSRKKDNLPEVPVSLSMFFGTFERLRRAFDKELKL